MCGCALLIHLNRFVVFLFRFFLLFSSSSFAFWRKYLSWIVNNSRTTERKHTHNKNNPMRVYQSHEWQQQQHIHVYNNRSRKKVFQFSCINQTTHTLFNVLKYTHSLIHNHNHNKMMKLNEPRKKKEKEINRISIITKHKNQIKRQRFSNSYMLCY